MRVALPGSISWRSPAMVLGQNLRIARKGAQISGCPGRLIKQSRCLFRCTTTKSPDHLPMSKTAVILILPQAFIGCVAQNPVAGPAAQLDLGNERRLREDQVLAFERQDRGFCPEFVEGRLRYAESFSLNPVPTEPTETQAEPPRLARSRLPMPLRANLHCSQPMTMKLSLCTHLTSGNRRCGPSGRYCRGAWR